MCRDQQSLSELIFFTVLGKGNTARRADIDAGITLDAEGAIKNCLHITVEAAFCFSLAAFYGKSEFYFHQPIP